MSSTSHLDGLDWPRSFPSAVDWTNHLNHISKPFVLTPEEEAERAAGRPVRRQADNGRISGRIIETVRGTRLRKLSPQEEDELVALEDRINSVKGRGFWGGARAVDFVSSNYNGLCPLDDAPATAPRRPVLPANSFILEDVLAYGAQVDPLDLLNKFVISRDDMHPDDADLIAPSVSIGGTATPTTDYQTLPTTVIVPAGKSSITLDVVGIQPAIGFESSENLLQALRPVARLLHPKKMRGRDLVPARGSLGGAGGSTRIVLRRAIFS